MSRTFDGDARTWWLHGRTVAENATTGDNLGNVTLRALDVDSGAELQVRSVVSGQITPLVTNARGETPGSFYLPAAQANLVAEGGDPVPSTTIEISQLVAQFATFDSRLSQLASAGGIPGEDGEPGTPGLSAFDLAKQQGFEGTLGDWLSSLEGEDGEGLAIPDVIQPDDPDLVSKIAVSIALRQYALVAVPDQ